MSLRDILHETWVSLTTNKARSFLTILGVMIGITSVIVMSSVVGGIRNSILDEDSVTASRRVDIAVASTELRQADLDAILEAFPEYETITPSAYTSSSLVAGGVATDSTQLFGVENDYFKIMGYKFVSGSYFTEQNISQSERVLIIDTDTVTTLFGSPDAPAIGQVVRTGPNEEEYIIVGVIATPAMMSGIGFIPLEVMQSRLLGIDGFMRASGLVKEGVDAIMMASQTQAFLAKHMRVDLDSVSTYADKQFIESIEAQATQFTILLTSIASISLFVGGIGIMNMMLTNVTERIREIGLRKSLGAHTSDIIKQFLAEAIALCLAGGFFGIVFGYIGTFLVSFILESLDPGSMNEPAISIITVFIAVAVCVFIGIVFGYYPARRAAKLDPVESLRYQ